MTRQELLEEFIQALLLGELITLVIFTATHELYHGMEVVAWWIAVHMIATYVVWTILDIRDRYKKSHQLLGQHDGQKQKIS